MTEHGLLMPSEGRPKLSYLLCGARVDAVEDGWCQGMASIIDGNAVATERR